MGRPSKYPRELRERAVRMVAEVRSDYPSEFQAMSAVAQMLGVGSAETIRTSIRRQQVDGGDRPGVMTDAAVESRSTFGRIEGPILRYKGNDIIQNFEDVW